MTTVKQAVKTSKEVKKEVRLIREAGRKVTATKEAARQFLISTGIYTSQGELQPQFR